jgi:hypothetical protein
MHPRMEIHFEPATKPAVKGTIAVVRRVHCLRGHTHLELV